MVFGVVAAAAYATEAGKSNTQGQIGANSKASDVRVFSKDKPLFGANRTIPNATPDRTGKTKVKVIVKPKAPVRQQTSSKKTTSGQGSAYAPSLSTSRFPAKAAKAPVESSPKPTKAQQRPALVAKPRIVREAAQPKRVKVRRPVKTRQSRRKVERAAKPPTRARRQVKVSGVVLPTAKPVAPNAYEPPQPRQSRAVHLRKPVLAKPAKKRRVRRIAKQRRKALRARKRVARLNARHRHRVRRIRRQPHWRRNAPPGTVGSFVRCWPGDPCVRYYRVRRPTTLRQYRRLVAWQRRQNQRLRYRRYYRRY